LAGAAPAAGNDCGTEIVTGVCGSEAAGVIFRADTFEGIATG
jgi:hypothetical protein